MAKSNEGQAEQADINKALLNRNNSLIAFRNANTEILKEKIYLGFLTGLKLEYLINGEFDFSIPLTDITREATDIDSLPEIINLKLQADLLGSQLKSEKRKYIPLLGVEGFLGANQFTYKFDPLDNKSWYGTSYIGLSLKLPLITGENKNNRIRQIRLQEESMNLTISDRLKSIISSNMQLAEEISKLEYQLEILQQNVSLLSQNAEIYREKYGQGQVNAAFLLDQDILLSKETSTMNETRAQLTYKKIELIFNSGMLK